MKRPQSFHPYAAITIVFWSMAYVLTRLALQHFSALSLGFLRYAVAAIALLPVCAARRMALPRKRDVPWLFAAGTCGFFLYMIAFNIGTGSVTAATSSVVIASVPVFTALLARLFLRERLTARQWAAIAVEFAGIVVLTMYGAVFSANVGALWLLLAALLLSVYNLLQRRLTRTYTPLQSTAYSIFFGAALLGIFLPDSLAELKTAPPIPILCVLLMGVFSSAVAYIAWAEAFERAQKTSQVSNYMFFTPFLTGVLGFLLAGEVPDASTWVGGGLILLGALLFNRKTRGDAAPAPPPQADCASPSE